jgi:ABC-type transport system substrate-binding protein
VEYKKVNKNMNKKALLGISLIVLFGFSMVAGNVLAQDVTIQTAFSINILSPNTSPARNQWSLLMEQLLPKVGIGISFHESTGWGNIGPRTWSYPFLDYNYIPVYEDGGYDLLFVGWSWGLDLDLTGLFDTLSIAPAGDNHYQYSNPVYDDLLDDYLAELDPVARIDIAYDLQEILYEDLPAIAIIYPQSLFGYKVGLTGIDDMLIASSNHRPWLWDDPDDHIIKYCIPADLREYNIYEAASFYDWQWLQCVHAALVQREQVTREWGPVIAKNWTLDGPLPGADNPINITVNLDPGAKFSDGEPVLPEDIKYTMQLHMSPVMASGSYGNMVRFLGTNDSIEITDNSPGGQIIFHLVTMYNFPLSLLNEMILDKHKGDGTGVEELIGTHGYDIFGLVPGTAPIGFNLVKSCGAFMINSFDSVSSTVHMVPNPYWDDTIVSGGSPPLLTDLYLSHVMGKDNAISELKLGNYDIMDAQYYPVLSDFEGETVIEGVLVGDPSHQEMSMNLKHPILGTGELTPLGTPEAGKFIRKAISHTVPRQTIVDEILEGLGSPATVPAPNVLVGFNDELVPYAFDLDLAIDFVEAAGFTVRVTATETGIAGLIFLSFLGLASILAFRRFRK